MRQTFFGWQRQIMTVLARQDIEECDTSTVHWVVVAQQTTEEETAPQVPQTVLNRFFHYIVRDRLGVVLSGHSNESVNDMRKVVSDFVISERPTKCDVGVVMITLPPNQSPRAAAKVADACREFKAGRCFLRRDKEHTANNTLQLTFPPPSVWIFADRMPPAAFLEGDARVRVWTFVPAPYPDPLASGPHDADWMRKEALEASRFILREQP